MNIRKNLNIIKVGKYFAFSGVLLFAVMQGCKKDTDNPYRVVNDWILETMEYVYYWNDNIPSDNNKSLKPDDYFNSLLYRGDRFSWIQDNFLELIESLSGVSTEAGYEFNLPLMPDDVNIIGYIAYIKPGTPAEATVLKRGDYFLTVNNKQLTINNYTTLMQEMTKPHSLGVAVIQGEEITGLKNVQLSSVIENYAENPILLDSVYNIPDKKIGYFVYNFFARDSKMSGIEYEKELNNLFGKFIDEGIDELIIDLRYNSGGTVVTAEALASMISNRSTTDVFGYEEYNSYVSSELEREMGKDYNVSYFPDHIDNVQNNTIRERVSINKLSGMDRVYLIVSEQTASASELIINCLKPYMDVILIGWTTVGKNVGALIIYEDDPVKQRTNKWGMLPIVSKFSNSLKQSNYANGFEPDVWVHESEELVMKPLGDIDELLLHTTLKEILGPAFSSTSSGNRGANPLVTRGKPRIIGSSIDRNPARKNMFVDLQRR